MKISPANNWREGIVDGYRFEAKVYDEPSIFGIDKGRVSKLYIYKDDVNIWAFDRGYAPENQQIPSNLIENILKELL